MCVRDAQKQSDTQKKLSQKKTHLRPVGECWLPARIGLGRERDGFMRKVLAVPLERAERAEADSARARVHVAAALHVHREVLGSNPRGGVVEFGGGKKKGRRSTRGGVRRQKRGVGGEWHMWKNTKFGGATFRDAS